jgi:hypothetical protein
MTQPTRTCTTPDGRYIVVRGRLWRAANPHLTQERRDALVAELMQARRDVHSWREDPSKVKEARGRVQKAKVALGERGPPWWNDDAPDLNRHMVQNTPYAAWFAALPEDR